MNISLWLAQNAPPPKSAKPYTMAQRLGHRVGDRQTARGDRQVAEALRLMREVWDLSRGYFPGREMPVPRFSRGGRTEGAVGWYPGRNGPTPIGVKLERSFVNDLIGYDHGHKFGKQMRQERFSGVVRDLLHEWAHNFQNPETYKNRKLSEGGAEAFANAVAPMIVRQLGRKYRRAPVAYRNATRLAVDRGMPWIIEDQFAQP